MGDVQIRIRAEGTRATASAVENINKRMERMMQLAVRNQAALTAMFKAANVQAQALKANMGGTLGNSQVSQARRITSELDREERKRTANAEREARKLTRIAEQEAKKRARIEEREAKKREKNSFGNKAKRFGGNLGSAIGYGALGLVGAGVAASVGMVAGEGKRALAIDERLTALRIAGRAPGQEGVNKQLLSDRVYGASKQYGLNPEDVTSGLESIVAKTGDMSFALNSIEVLAKVSRATGANMEDLGGVASDLMQKFDIKTPEQLAESLAILNMQAKKGAVELKDFAAYLPEMAAAASRFGLRGASGAQMLGGLAQIAKQSTGSAAEASTAVQMMFSDLLTNSGKIKNSYGIDVIDKKTNQGKAIEQLLPELIGKTGGDPTKLNELFGERGIRAISPMMRTYNDVRNAGGSKEDAIKAVRDMIMAAQDASNAKAEVDRDAAEKMETASAKWAAAQAAMTEKMSQVNWDPLIAAIPTVGAGLMELARVIVDLLDYIDKVTGNEEKRKAERDIQAAQKNRDELQPLLAEQADLKFAATQGPLSDKDERRAIELATQIQDKKAEMQSNVAEAKGHAAKVMEQKKDFDYWTESGKGAAMSAATGGIVNPGSIAAYEAFISFDWGSLIANMNAMSGASKGVSAAGKDAANEMRKIKAPDTTTE